MAFGNFSLTTAKSTLITMLNTQLTAVGKLFKDQTIGDFVDQVRYNSALKRKEYWTGSAWAALPMDVDTVDTYHANPTPAANTIPVGDANGRISWGAKPAFRGALVYNNPSATVGFAPTWSAEVYDTDTIHNLVTNTSRLTVPSGVTKIKIMAGVYGAAGIFEIRVVKNNADFAGGPHFAGQSTTAIMVDTMTSTVLTVVSGDYFELKVISGTISLDVTGQYNWFAMEIIE